jgi:hypothetical protein
MLSMVQQASARSILLHGMTSWGAKGRKEVVCTVFVIWLFTSYDLRKKYCGLYIMV